MLDPDTNDRNPGTDVRWLPAPSLTTLNRLETMSTGGHMSFVLVRETMRIGYLSLVINLMGLAILRARADVRQSRAKARRSRSKAGREQR